MTTYVESLRCNNCETVVRISCDRPITPKEIEELQKRMLCHPCLQKKIKEKG